MDVIDLLACDNYLIVNRDLMMGAGIVEAMLIGELASEFRYWRKAGKLDDGWFYSTCDNLENKLPFSRPTIKKAIDHLKSVGVLETELRGMPAKNYYRINTSQLEKFLQHVCKDFSKQVCKDFYTKNIEEEYRTINTGEKDFDADDAQTIIPLAAPTTKSVEVETFSSDDNGKTIVVKRKIPQKVWNKAVRIWRKDEDKFARVEFEDEPGKMTNLRPSQIKSWNVRPQAKESSKQYTGSTEWGL